MKRFTTVTLAFLVLALPTIAVAAPYSLQEVEFNLDGALQHDDFTGLNTGGFNTTTGLGTLTWTFTGAPGAHFFDAFFDDQVNLPFFNEFASVHGALAAGQTYQIGDPAFADPDLIFTNTVGNSLDNTNKRPGAVSNFNGSCVGANCNGDVAMAMGFNFNLAAGEQAVVTLTFSTVAPTGGFYLQQTHPQDAANQAALNLFFQGGVVIEPACIGNDCAPAAVPEPASLLLLGTGLVGVVRRVSRKGIRKFAE